MEDLRRGLLVAPGPLQKLHVRGRRRRRGFLVLPRRHPPSSRLSRTATRALATERLGRARGRPGDREQRRGGKRRRPRRRLDLQLSTATARTGGAGNSRGCGGLDLGSGAVMGREVCERRICASVGRPRMEKAVRDSRAREKTSELFFLLCFFLINSREKIAHIF